MAELQLNVESAQEKTVRIVFTFVESSVPGINGVRFSRSAIQLGERSKRNAASTRAPASLFAQGQLAQGAAATNIDKSIRV